MTTTTNIKKAKKPVLVARATAAGVTFMEHGVTRSHFTMNSCTPDKRFMRNNEDKYLTNGRHDINKSEHRKKELAELKRKQDLIDKIRRKEADRLVEIYPKVVTFLSDRDKRKP